LKILYPPCTLVPKTPSSWKKPLTETGHRPTYIYEKKNKFLAQFRVLQLADGAGEGGGVLVHEQQVVHDHVVRPHRPT
jgi:hypothetical protein